MCCRRCSIGAKLNNLACNVCMRGITQPLPRWMSGVFQTETIYSVERLMASGSMGCIIKPSRRSAFSVLRTASFALIPVYRLRLLSNLYDKGEHVLSW